MAITIKKLSAAEAQDTMAKRAGGAHLREVGGQQTIVKAATERAGYDKQNRAARFIMSTEEQDRYGDIVKTAGIDTTNFERNPVALMGHSHRVSVGNWANLQKVLSGRPRRLEGDLILLPEGGPVKEVEETAWLMEHNGLRACSIGFLPDWEEVEGVYDDDDEWVIGLQFNKSELIECSPCIIPANPGALMKHADGSPAVARELLEQILDEWTKDPVTGLVMPRKDFEAAYEATLKDEGGKKSYHVIAKSEEDPKDPPAEEPKEPENNPEVPPETVTSDDVDPNKDKGDNPPAPEVPPETVTTDDVPTDKSLHVQDTKAKPEKVTITLNFVEGQTKHEVTIEQDGKEIHTLTVSDDPQKDIEQLEQVLSGMDEIKKIDGFLDTVRMKFMEFFMPKAEQRAADAEDDNESDEPEMPAPEAITLARARAAAALANARTSGHL